MVQAIHHLDLLLWLLGDAETVMGKTSTQKHDIEVEDTAVAVLRFKNGALATIEASTAVPKTLNDRLEIHGEKGSAILTKHKLAHRISLHDTDTRFFDKLKTQLTTYKKGTIQDQIEDFITAIRENTQPKVTGEDGLRALKVINSIYQSERLKKEVKVSSSTKE